MSFKGSRRLVWFGVASVVILNGAALYLLRVDSMPILTICLPSILGLVGAWSHVVNKAEVEYTRITQGK